MRIVFQDFPSKFFGPSLHGEIKLSCEFIELEEFLHEINKILAEVHEQWPKAYENMLISLNKGYLDKERLTK